MNQAAEPKPKKSRQKRKRGPNQKKNEIAGLDPTQNKRQKLSDGEDSNYAERISEINSQKKIGSGHEDDEPTAGFPLTKK